jgi:hypothetical protein
VLSPRGYELDVSMLGKAATWVLYAAIGFRIVTANSTMWPLWLFWIGLGMAVVAALFYVRDAWNVLRR